MVKASLEIADLLTFLVKHKPTAAAGVNVDADE